MNHLEDRDADGLASMDDFTEENSPPVCLSCGEAECRCLVPLPPCMKAELKEYNDQF